MLGRQRRFWCGPRDPDPVIAQIGAVKLSLVGQFPIVETHKSYVRPIDRFGQQFAIDPFFTRLTGVSEEDIASRGVSLTQALQDVDRFSDGERFWSRGKDELNMVAISCYVEGVTPVIPARRFDNAVRLLLAAGMPAEDVAKTPSNKLADYFGIAHPPLQSHDALDDTLSVAYTLQHLLRLQKLAPAALN